MKDLLNWWNKQNVVAKIVVGLIIGTILGVMLPAAKNPEMQWIGIFGDLYIGALKAIAPLLVFVLVLSSLASGELSGKGGGKSVGKIVIIYLVSSFIASALAVFASFAYKVTIPGLKAAVGSEVANTNFWDSFSEVLKGVVANPIKGIVDGSYLPILFWAVILGIILKAVAKKETKQVLSDFGTCLSKAVLVVVGFAPFGVMGLIFTAVSTTGVQIFVDYGKLIMLLVVVMAIVMFITNPIIAAIVMKKNPYPLLFKCLRDSAINAFFTRSSAANIPSNLKICEELKLDRSVYSITIPLGATINMAGAAAVITIMTLSTAWTLGISVAIPHAILMAFIGTLAAAGSAGVAGGSLMLIPLACSLYGIPSDIAWFTVGVGGQIGVVQDSCETAINSSSDVYYTAAVLLSDKKENKSSKKKHK